MTSVFQQSAFDNLMSYVVEEGTKLSPALHQIVGTEVAEESGLIIRTVKSGFQGKDGVIVRLVALLSKQIHITNSTHLSDAGKLT